MFHKKTIKDIDVKNKVILVRTDYNVPLKDGVVTSDLRIRASLPTINYLLEHGATKIILISHLGRPDGARQPELSLAPVAKVLAELLPGHPVEFVGDVSGPDVERAVDNLSQGGILLLENLRFFSGEEKDSADFAAELIESTHADIFVQDGFAVIHRAHASTSAITKDLPSVAGLLLEKEVSTLTQVSENPDSPVLVIIGGAKVDDKQPLIDHFLAKAEAIAVGGKIAADGYTASNDKIYVATDFAENAEGTKLDIGPASTAHIVELVNSAQTIIWNGVLGLVEQPEFATSSLAVARAIGQRQGITSVICGGDTAGFVENLAEQEPDLQYSLISTGGGASLELLSGLHLPGLDALEDK
ncbi:phosphoglycerate kinase [Candidatus Saccharibacteria bacterium]|nr:phosphoglycerate kinase [Candidatus Saccharibacteria bacterium]